jgi:hypothetical protein
MSAAATVVLASEGRGGSIGYFEQGRRIGFSWEFAMPPALALVFGPSARAFEHEAPWAAGRRAEVYDTVGREVVRQQAPGGSFVVDLEAGMIEILRRAP